MGFRLFLVLQTQHASENRSICILWQRQGRLIQCLRLALSNAKLNRCFLKLHLRMETDALTETLCSEEPSLLRYAFTFRVKQAKEVTHTSTLKKKAL